MAGRTIAATTMRCADMNKTREQWQKVDAKYCAEHNSSAANFYLIRDAQQDIERLHRALAEQSAPAGERETIRAEVEGLRADAERFRWLAHRGDACQWMNIIRVDPDDFESYAEAVDAAMTAKET